ncbi:MAG: CRISPR-associated endonuclease Cas1, partial [Acidimicrobiales bacterium]
ALHLDAVNRDSMVLDLLEPIRPEIDRFVIDLMAEATFNRSDFIERGDGSIRIAPALVQRLASTMPTWSRAASPHAERVAHVFGQLVAGKWQPRTPLTKRNARAAAAVVKARKQQAASKGRQSAKIREGTRRHDLDSFAGCVDCGGPLDRASHLRCSRCWERQPGQSKETRQRRGRAIGEARAAQERWRRENPDAVLDREDFRQKILPGLSRVKLAEIMEATGCTKSSASSYRTGRRTPHPMYWRSLLDLARRQKSKSR